MTCLKTAHLIWNPPGVNFLKKYLKTEFESFLNCGTKGVWLIFQKKTEIHIQIIFEVVLE